MAFLFDTKMKCGLGGSVGANRALKCPLEKRLKFDLLNIFQEFFQVRVLAAGTRLTQVEKIKGIPRAMALQMPQELECNIPGIAIVGHLNGPLQKVIGCAMKRFIGRQRQGFLKPTARIVEIGLSAMDDRVPVANFGKANRLGYGLAYLMRCIKVVIFLIEGIANQITVDIGGQMVI